MSPFAHTLTGRFGSNRGGRDARKSLRKKVGSKAWIRLQGGFSVRPCTVADLSHTGVRLIVDPSHQVSDHFNLMFSRDEAPGRHCRVKWRRGSQIGAEFL